MSNYNLLSLSLTHSIIFFSCYLNQLDISVEFPYKVQSIRTFIRSVFGEYASMNLNDFATSLLQEEEKQQFSRIWCLFVMNLDSGFLNLTTLSCRLLFGRGIRIYVCMSISFKVTSTMRVLWFSRYNDINLYEKTR